MGALFFSPAHYSFIYPIALILATCVPSSSYTRRSSYKTPWDETSLATARSISPLAAEICNLDCTPIVHLPDAYEAAANVKSASVYVTPPHYAEAVLMHVRYLNLRNRIAWPRLLIIAPMDLAIILFHAPSKLFSKAPVLPSCGINMFIIIP